MQYLGIIQWCLEHLNYWTITILMMIESSFIPFPSEIVIPPAAWKAASDDSLTLVGIILCATIGANLGALINYYLSVTLGRTIIYRLAEGKVGKWLLLSRSKLETAEDYFRKHGAISTLIGRLIPAVRQLISIPAGLSRMPIWKFLLFTSIGAMAWNTILATLGYSLSKVPGISNEEELIETVTRYSHMFGYSFLALGIVLVLWAVYRGMKKKNTVKNT